MKHKKIEVSRIRVGNCNVDIYQAEAKFSENNKFEVGQVRLRGRKNHIIVDFPFCHCYRITDRLLANSLCQVPALEQEKPEYPIYRLSGSRLLEEVVQMSGGLFDTSELEHYQVLSENLVIDIVLRMGEKVLLHKEGGMIEEVD